MSTEEVFHKHLEAKLHVKTLSETGEFEGYAAAYTIDSESERIAPGAFKRTLKHSDGGKIPILFGHSTNEPVGWNIEAKEIEGNGLWVHGKLVLETEAGRKAYYFLRGAMEVGAPQGAGLSIGFRSIKSHYESLASDDAISGLKKGTQIRVFDEVALLEYSVCVFQANRQAYVTAVKSAFDENSTTTEEHSMSEQAAEQMKSATTKRVAGVDLPAHCFAYVGDPEKTDTWKLPIEFPGDEEKTKSHIRNALARFSQTDGIPDSEKGKVLAKIRAAAKKHGIDSGDDDSGGKSADASSGGVDFDAALRDRQRQREFTQNRRDIEGALYDTLSAIHAGQMDADTKKALVKDAYHKHAAAMADWHIKSYFGDGAEKEFTPELHRKDAVHINALSAEETALLVKSKMPAAKKATLAHAMDLHGSAIDLHNKALRIVKDLMDGDDPSENSIGTEMGSLSSSETAETKDEDSSVEQKEAPVAHSERTTEQSDGDSEIHSLMSDLLQHTKSRLEAING